LHLTGFKRVGVHRLAVNMSYKKDMKDTSDTGVRKLRFCENTDISGVSTLLEPFTSTI